MRIHVLPALILGAAVAGTAHAQWAPDVNIGTLGAGAGATIALTGSTSARLAVAGWTFKRDVSESGVDYHAKLKLLNAPMLLDWHPGGGWFRMSGGIVLNDDKATLDAVPSSSATFTFNGNQHAASEVGSATGSVKFNSVAPYAGIGFGNPVGKTAGWSFSTDLGVMYLGKPKASLTVNCSASLTASQCASLQSDANAEADQLNDAIKKYRWYPVVQFHIGRKF
jgi:hypothetical protein